jgi:site-specific DNA-methyltransferase (adenine-specific)
MGDVRTRLNDIPDNTIQACITSPPYWGLRDYGTATWEGGDPSCDHLGKPMATKANINKNCGTGNDVKNAEAREFYKDICGKCGARRIDSQIGLEQTPDEYVAEMVAVFREVRRVLKDDGVLWLNLGDSYNGAAMNRSGQHGYDDGRTNRSKRFSAGGVDGLKPKDLVGIPWRVAFALQADGWWLRQDIIWHKPNPMPESVTDRCTKAHEYLFLLTKSAKYYFNNKAIKEPVAASSLARAEYGWDCDRPSTKNASMGGQGIHVEKMGTRFVNPEGRNKRSVWTIPTKPFRGAHFAVMPEALVEPCILASSRPDDTILDPFTGSGTVAVVSLRHGRNYIGTELNPEYVDIARERITQADPLYTQLTVE